MMTSSQTHRKLTLEEVNCLGEVWEGFMLMEEHGVSKDNCVCLQDIKDRLRLHHYRMLGQGKSPQAVSDFTCTDPLAVMII